jgi:hypothetical protein
VADHLVEPPDTTFNENVTSTEHEMADLDVLNGSERVKQHVRGCFIEESSGLLGLDRIGEDNVMIETDYPHSEIVRGTAERLYCFTPVESDGKAG